MTTTSASSSSSWRSLRSAAVPERVPERGRELVHLAQPVGDDARRRDDERLERLALALDLRVLALHGEEQRERLHGLAEPHVVGEDAAGADLVEEPEPVEPLLLVRAELRLEVARLAASPLISSMSRSFLKSSLRVVGDARRARPGRAAPGCGPPARAGACRPCPPPVARISAWRRSTSRTFCGVELANDAVGEAHVACGPRRGSARARPA